MRTVNDVNGFYEYMCRFVPYVRIAANLHKKGLSHSESFCYRLYFPEETKIHDLFDNEGHIREMINGRIFITNMEIFSIGRKLEEQLTSVMDNLKEFIEAQADTVIVPRKIDALVFVASNVDIEPVLVKLSLGMNIERLVNISSQGFLEQPRKTRFV